MPYVWSLVVAQVGAGTRLLCVWRLPRLPCLLPRSAAAPLLLLLRGGADGRACCASNAATCRCRVLACRPGGLAARAVVRLLHS